MNKYQIVAVDLDNPKYSGLDVELFDDISLVLSKIDRYFI